MGERPLIKQAMVCFFQKLVAGESVVLNTDISLSIKKAFLNDVGLFTHGRPVFGCADLLLCYRYVSLKLTAYEPFHGKTSNVDFALSIDPDQPKHAAQANPGRHFSSPVDFLLY